MNTERIANRQLFAILFIIHTTIVIALLPVLTTADAFQDAWLAVFISLLGIMVTVRLLVALGMRFPRETIIQYSVRLLGPWAGRAISLSYLWLLLHIAAIEVRFYAEVLINGYLSETPMLFVISSMVIAAAVAAYCGVEVIGRLADIILPLFILMIVFSLVVPLPTMNLAHLEPILDRGVGPLLRGSVTHLAMGAQFILVSFILPTLVKPKQAVRWVLGAVLLSSIVLFFTTIVVIGVLGAEEGARSFFPMFRMLRSVPVSPVVERIEALIVFAWGMGLFIGLASYIWAGARGMSQFFGIASYRSLVPPMAVIWILLANHNFEDIFEISTFLGYRYAGPYVLTLVLLPMAVLWPAWFIYNRLKRGSSVE